MRHPANLTRDVGQRAADAVTGFMGSWRFIGLQSVSIAAWIVLNVTALVRHWDPYPWILLNLLFSVQAAYASPLILLAQNRQVEHDRDAAEHDYAANGESLTLLQHIHAAVVPAESTNPEPLDNESDQTKRC